MQLHITTYGTYLHVKDSMFDVRRKGDDGRVLSATYSAEKVTHILLATGTSLSTDAVKLAMRHNVDIVFLERDGDPMGRVWHAKLGSTTKIRKRQLEVSLGAEGLRWVRTWLLAKLDNQAGFIRSLKKHRLQHSAYLDDKLARLDALSVSISTLDGARVADVADTLRGLEGTAGRLYFETLSYVLPADYQFNGRSSRPAHDAFNAFLNYAYGMLYGKVEKTLMLAGLDPYVGFLHRDDYNQLSMVYDFIEPYRGWADEVVFRLFSAKKVNKSHVDAVSGGRNGGAKAGESTPGESTPGVSLNAEGKPLLVNAFNEFMDNDPIRYRGRNLVRSHCIQLDAHQFANELIGKTGGMPELTML
ncbi:CRISPR-associated endonuclease Cas1 [Spirosoma montaniterrae]|uniref:CRISPR-associated endonuclease Cas1 n=1 Tax=Spirosoma montaniterrae TaxID=1178516 RepID=A0A1P9WYN1_9BACT|nr:CRISPR-associated endonuclease Cas1 [Spirosoma montaniterrae]AQG80463.1 CRISPR-associated protein Cas1 [Spirosoma montaniterrae]